MAGLDVNAKLTLDSSNFDANMQKSAAEATATGRAAAKAAKQAADAQKLAADLAGEAISDQTRKAVAGIKAQAAASSDYSAVQRAVRRGHLEGAQAIDAEAAAYQRKTASARQAADAARVEAEKERMSIIQQERDYQAYLARREGMLEAEVAAESGLNKRQQASATLRGGGLRASENIFSAVVPEAALELGGYAAGVGALAAVLVELGEKGAESFQKVRHAAELAHAAFEESHEKSRLLIDDKEIENQKIQDQIDKISGHPNNGLASALLEAKKMADQLMASLSEDRKQLEALFKQSDVGAFGKALQTIGVGAESTKPQEKNLLNDSTNLQRDLTKLRNDYNQAMSSAADDKARQGVTREFNKRFGDRLDFDANNYAREKARLEAKQSDQESNRRLAQAGGGGKEFGGLNTDVTDVSAMTQQLQDRIEQLKTYKQAGQLDVSIFEGKTALGQAKQDKFNEPGDDKAEAARRKAAEAQMKGFEDLLAAKKNDHDVSLAEEYSFWQSMEAAARRYPENIRKVTEKTGQLYQEMGRQLEELLRKYDSANKEATRKAAETAKLANESLSKLMEKGDALDAQRAEASAKLAEVQADNAAKMREAITAHDLLTGAITRQDAARQRAAEHAAGFAAKLIQIEEDRKAQLAKQKAEDPYGVLPEQRDVINRKADAQRAGVQGDADRTSAADALALELARKQDTAWGGAQLALEEFTKSALDSSAQMRNIVSATLHDINQKLVEDLTTRHGGDHHQVREVGHALATRVTGSALEQSEGKLLSAFGLGGGKAPKGTAADPLHVVLAGMKSVGGAVSSTASTLSKGAGGLFSSMLSMLPHFADGTSSFGGGWAMVGERGPELVNLPGGSGVTPNHKLGQVMGGAGGHTIMVDARGATDPAQVRFQVHQGIREAAPHLNKSAHAYSADRKSRKVGGG